MTKEEITSLHSYCKEHNIAKASRLRELGISKNNYYNSCRRHGFLPPAVSKSAPVSVSNSQKKDNSLGTFLPLSFGSGGSTPTKSTRSSRKKDFEMSKGTPLTIEMRTSCGTELRIQGQINVKMLREIVICSSSSITPESDV